MVTPCKHGLGTNCLYCAVEEQGEAAFLAKHPSGKKGTRRTKEHQA